MTIAFDVDGTLLDSRQRYYRAHVLALETGASPLAADAYWELKRRHVPEAEILRAHGLDDDPDVYESRRVALLEDPALLALDVPLPTVAEALALLRKDHRLVVISLRRQPGQLPAQLEGFFPAAFPVVAAGPPDPTPWEAKARLLAEHAPDAAWIVGDTEADVRGGKLAGIKTCAVATGIRTREALEAMRPDAVVDALAELSALVSDK